MDFNSHIFILAFLPVFVILYNLLRKLRPSLCRGLLILGGAVFYAFAGWETAAVLGLSVFVNFAFAILMSKSARGKLLLVLDVAFNLLFLLRFKYLNFAIDTLNSLTHRAISHRELILPLGISFFTFQQIMYLVSVWKGESKVVLSDYLSYILYFPKLLMGPLMEPSDFFVQLRDPCAKPTDWADLADGLRIFSLGLFKTVLLADTFEKAVAWGFQNGIATAAAPAAATSADLFLVMLFYSFQIYFDFSGYSDMAVGISKMLHIDLPMNFDSPYKAVSIRDFWKRWHISLTRFLTRYVYFPLGGSRKGEPRTYLNIMLVFLISGLWHGANWTFVLWGCLHGLLHVLERLFRNAYDRLFGLVRRVYTFLSVSVLWLLFRSDTVGNWLNMLKTMFSLKSMDVSDGLLKTFELTESEMIFDLLRLQGVNNGVRGFSMLIFLAAGFLICLIPENNYRRLNKTGLLSLIPCAVAFLWAFLCMSTESVFVYSGF